jgi:hypothetical protein
MSVQQYKRIVLKLSGEAMAGGQGFGLSPEIIKSVAAQVKDVVETKKHIKHIGLIKNTKLPHLEHQVKGLRGEILSRVYFFKSKYI